MFSYQTALLAMPSEGQRIIPARLDFQNVGSIETDLTEFLLSQKMSFVQSVYIDNSLNGSALDLRFIDGETGGYLITAQPYSQGWYPVAVPIGGVVFTATTAQGIIVPIKLANCAMPYFTWGALDGVPIVPALVNVGFEPLALGVGDNQLVAGVGGETVKLYRGLFNVDDFAVLKFTDGPGGAVLFSAYLTPAGSLTLQASAAPQFSTGVGNALTLNSSAAVNLYGGFGYVRS